MGVIQGDHHHVDTPTVCVQVLGEKCGLADEERNEITKFKLCHDGKIIENHFHLCMNR